MTDDAELLRQYVQADSEDAFAELVQRHLPVVYSSALRQTDGDVELAKDICQTVFIDLGRKAGSLLGHELLIGWLFSATRFAAATVLRGNRRRQIREGIAVSMHEDAATPALECRNPKLASVLDAAMEELASEDRNAVLLRFFQGKDFKDVGAALGISEDAARMRVTRAIGKLHSLLESRGVTVSAAALGSILATEAVTAVPAGLAATISTAALAGIPLATTATATANAAKAIAMTGLQKANIAAALAVVVATPLIIQHNALTKALAEQSTLLAGTNDAPIQPPATRPIGDTEDRTWRDNEDLTRLRSETATLRARISELYTQAQGLAATDPLQQVPSSLIGETLRLADAHDAGQATPAALLQTHTWAMLHGDTNRLAHLLVLSPETDVGKLQRMLEALSKEATKGMTTLLAESPLSEIRLLEEQPAENNDRWVVHEFVAKDGSVALRARIRVRPTGAGWKLVIGVDGQNEVETVEDHR